MLLINLFRDGVDADEIFSHVNRSGFIASNFLCLRNLFLCNLGQGVEKNLAGLMLACMLTEYESFFDYIARFLFWIRDSKVQT